jgi:hypothetical protein
MTPITNHIEQALSKLVSRYKNKPKFYAWIASAVRQIQKLEDATWIQINNRDVDTCDEPRLRLLAKIVGQDFLGATLDEFRLYVKVRILVNRSRGMLPDLLRISKLLFGPTSFEEPGNAHLILTAETPVTGPVNPNIAAAFLRDAKAAGVGLSVIYSTIPNDRDFTWGWAGEVFDPFQSWSWNNTEGDPGGSLAATA